MGQKVAELLVCRPGVVNWLMPRCRAAGLQCDQKVNKKLGLFCGKRSIEITAAVTCFGKRTPQTLLRRQKIPSAFALRNLREEPDVFRAISQRRS